jgi:hypothetical protein
MRFGLTTLMAAGVLIGTSAAAQEQRWVQTEETMPARLIEVGTWQFAATKRGPDGKPECFESWTFNADGTGSKVSGQQQIATRWAAKRVDDIGQFVFITNLTTTDGPDCMGRVPNASRYPYESAGFQLIFFGGGASASVCTAGKQVHTPDGGLSWLLDADDCWGTIAPMPKG